jgi:hypothetical protein
MALSQLADWWDEQKRISERILTEWVQENPQWWAIGVAGTVQTTMDLGAGMVDVLRLGEGIAQGGLKGVGKDALRLLVILGPLGRAGGMLSRMIHLRRLRFAVQVAGVDGPCTFQAVNNAMMILKGKNLFITVKDMAAAMGKHVSSLTKDKDGLYQIGAWIDELVPLLRSNGAMVKEVKGLTQLSEVANLARRESGVVIFAIKSTVIRTVQKAGGITTTEAEEILHSVSVFRNSMGQIRYADYGGKVVNSLEQLIKNLNYGSPTKIELLQSGSSATVIEGMKLTGEYAVKLARGAFLVIEGVTMLDTPEGADFAVPVTTVVTTPPGHEDPSPPEVIQGSFDAFKARQSGHQVIRLPEIVIRAARPKAPRSDWLTGVQFRLNSLGFGAGRVDGVMGPRTKQAVRAFQKAYPPLMIDGIPGPRTQSKLVAVCGY